MKSYIKDTNDFFIKFRSLLKLPSEIILCTVDDVALYSNIPHEKDQCTLRRRLDNRKENYISTDMLRDQVKVVLKNNIFKFSKKIFKQKREATIGTKFAPSYNNHIAAELEKSILRKAEL